MNPIAPKNQVAAVLGSGAEQVYAIRLAQELGIRVLGFDRNANAPGLAMADEAFAIDPQNRAAVLKVCRARDVAFLLPTPMGALLEVAGFLNEQLGLPGLRQAAAQLCSDKLAMRQKLQAAGLAQPWFGELYDPEAIASRADQLGWPVIIKPRSGSGSHGVVVLRDADELPGHLDWHRAHAARGGVRASTLLEQWIPGPEFGMDAAMVGGVFHAICLRRKEVTPLPFRLALGVSTPPNLTKPEEGGLNAAAEQACRALGLDDCLVHVDLIMEAGTGRAVVIELSGRPSGFRISSQFVPLVKGFEPVREMIRHYQGLRTDFSPRMNRAGVMRMLPLPEGRVVSVGGIDRARSVKDVVVFDCPLRPGDVVGRTDCGSSVLGNGGVIAIAGTVDRARAACAEAAAALQVEIETPILIS